MGNIGTLGNKLKTLIISAQSDQQLTYFQIQQNTVYSNQIGRKCLEHMIDVSQFMYLQTLKKIHKYLHPALKYIQYCHYLSNSGHENEQKYNFIRVHQEQLISSAVNILQMYCVHLSRVVPANISYLHFMREKDFYIHYNALKYVLQIWKISSIIGSGSRSFDVFSRLLLENRLAYIKLMSHWLYDMVKYKCSAIYLESNTLPYLIVINAIVLCGLLDYDKLNLLEECRRKEKNEVTKSQIYEHTLYAFTFILSECHVDKRNGSSQGNGYIQIVLLGISKLINMMWKDYQKVELEVLTKKTMYAPSYWYVQSIEYIQHPQLENIIFRLVLDMIKKKNVDLWENVDKNIKINIKQFIDQEFYHKKNNLKYQNFIDEIDVKKVIKQGYTNRKEQQVQQVQSNNTENKQKKQFVYQDHQNIYQSHSKIEEDKINNQHRKNQIFHSYCPVNNLTEIMFYHCISSILQYFPSFIRIKELQQVLESQIKIIKWDSFIRAYILEIIRYIKFGKKHQGWGSDQISQKNGDKYHILYPSLEEYYNNNQMDYSFQNSVIPYMTVGKNCSTFLNVIFPKIMKNYYKQINLTVGEIWEQILQQNTHELKEKLK